jgi:hypothetical protein
MRAVAARPVTGTSHTGHSHSRLDHASALANRNATTAASSPGRCYHALSRARTDHLADPGVRDGVNKRKPDVKLP